MSSDELRSESGNLTRAIREWERQRRELDDLYARAEPKRERLQLRLERRAKLGVIGRTSAILTASITAVGRRMSGLRHPFPIATVSFLLLTTIGVVAFQFWPSNSYANVAKQVTTCYSQIESTNLDQLKAVLASSKNLSPAERQSLLSPLLPNFDQLQDIFDRGTKLPESSPELIMAKAKSFAGRSRLEMARGSASDVQMARSDLSQAQSLFAKLPSSVQGDIYAAETALALSTSFASQGQYLQGLNISEKAIRKIDSLVLQYPKRVDARFLKARLLGNRALCKRYMAANGQAEDAKAISNLFQDSVVDSQNAIKLVDAIVRENLADPIIIEWQSRLIGNHGDLLLSLPPNILPNANAEAEKYVARAFEIAQGLARDFPNSFPAQDAFALAALNRGNDLLGHDRLDDAQAYFSKSKEKYDWINKQYPHLMDIEWGQAQTRKLLADVLAKQASLLKQSGKQVESQAKTKKAYDELKDAQARYKELVRVYKGQDGIQNDQKDLERINAAISKLE